VALEEMGPSLDLVLRRTREAPPDLAKEACKRPTPPKKVGQRGLRAQCGRLQAAGCTHARTRGGAVMTLAYNF
jgi:hypothetical protein